MLPKAMGQIGYPPLVSGSVRKEGFRGLRVWLGYRFLVVSGAVGDTTWAYSLNIFWFHLLSNRHINRKPDHLNFENQLEAP